MRWTWRGTVNYEPGWPHGVPSLLHFNAIREHSKQFAGTHSTHTLPMLVLSACRANVPRLFEHGKALCPHARHPASDRSLEPRRQHHSQFELTRIDARGAPLCHLGTHPRVPLTALRHSTVISDGTAYGAGRARRTRARPDSRAPRRSRACEWPRKAWLET